MMTMMPFFVNGVSRAAPVRPSGELAPVAAVVADVALGLAVSESAGTGVPAGIVGVSLGALTEAVGASVAGDAEPGVAGVPWQPVRVITATARAVAVRGVLWLRVRVPRAEFRMPVFAMGSSLGGGVGRP